MVFNVTSSLLETKLSYVLYNFSVFCISSSNYEFNLVYKMQILGGPNGVIV